MFRMQQLQPMISQLKEKYKHDKQRMGKEQMLLFKKHGANPMSGCLPMLLQLPVFFALFRTLQLSFEMRQAPFLLWVNDLSRPDTLLLLPFTIPFLGNGPQYIAVNHDRRFLCSDEANAQGACSRPTGTGTTKDDVIHAHYVCLYII